MKNALDHVGAIVGSGRPVLFLDFDGTLADIAPRPDLAEMAPSMRDALVALIQSGVPMAIVSGRDLEDLRMRVDLPGFWYAGSHGFDLLGPAPGCMRHQPGEEYLLALDELERAVRAHLGSFPGIFMERKRFAFAAHYRLVEPSRISTVIDTVKRMAGAQTGVQVREGKMVLEMVPDLPWNKGSAVLWILDRMKAPGRAVYLGDDITDEDAFRALQGRGIGIKVQEEMNVTAASYKLKDPADVERFLWLVVSFLGRSKV